MSDHNESSRSRPSDRLVEKSDRYLVEIVKKGEDPEEIERSKQILWERYQPKFEVYVREVLQEHVVSDVIQEIWAGFYHNIRRSEIEKDVSHWLWGIARNKRADAVEKLNSEKEIELDIDVFDIDIAKTGGSVEEILEWEEAKTQRELLLDFLPQFALVDSVLSDCQRVLWILSKIYDYPSKVVARLIGKKVKNIDVQTYRARKKVAEYIKNNLETFTWGEHTHQALPQLWKPEPISENALIVERFTEPATPQFTSEEIKPLGLTLEELHQHYVVSLMLPRWWDKMGRMGTTPPSLLLTRKPDWEQMKQLFERLSRDPSDLPDEFPEECLIRFDVEGDHLNLRVDPLLQVFPEDPQHPLDADHYLSVHSHQIRLPVVLATYDEDLSGYEQEIRERWPFINPEQKL